MKIKVVLIIIILLQSFLSNAQINPDTITYKPNLHLDLKRQNDGFVNTGVAFLLIGSSFLATTFLLDKHANMPELNTSLKILSGITIVSGGTFIIIGSVRNKKRIYNI